ncbi:MAG: CRP/FNR family cyclic AMP-dependent transcriptional regulator [Halioglobus sp.]|jgi:CRP/FNR family cyclic AMP-dependent transcriptional regulator
MLANVELADDFTFLSKQYRNLVEALLDIVRIPPVTVDVATTITGNFMGFDGGTLYVVEAGSLSARYHNRTVYILEQGEILLPDITGTSDHESTVYFGSDTGASLRSYPALEFMRRVFDEPEAVKIWTRLLITYSGLMLRISASNIDEDNPPTPGFEIYEPGETIIREGDRADYVFNLSSGVAEVSVDGVSVGRIAEGEIFGAMAALTHADRSATVRAQTKCSVVKVPREQFQDLIRNNPATIHSLLTDMANSIVNLNEQLVGMSSNLR